MALRSTLAVAAALVLLAGCAAAPQAPLDLDSAKIATKDVRIGVAMTPMPKPDTHLPGAGCLLCIASAQIANRTLIDHSQHLPTDDLAQFKEDVAKSIRAKGGQVIVIDAPVDVSTLASANASAPNTPRKDFRPLRERLNVDKLVVIEIDAVGMWRTYSAYFPTAEPKAVVQGKGYMVDLASNTYEWYQPVMVLKASDKEWDEPPKFPGLTNAYFQAVETSRGLFLKPFH